jgi:WD40 repeat protein
MNRRPPIAVLALPAFLFAALPSSVAGQSRPDWVYRDIIPGGHRGPVNALIYQDDRILSAGEDGFFEIWNIRTGAAEERFQVSPYRINAMVLRPGKPEICFIESDGLGLYRISVWDFRKRTNIFTLRFRDPVNYVNYSAGGGFLIVARSGRTGLVFIHPETGELLHSPQDLRGLVQFAATGRSERNMIVYLAGGVLSYWDLRSGNETGHFEVSPNISSPIIFGNNRFFAGIDSRGLVIIDAVSGNELARNSSIPRGSVLSAAEATEFICLVQNGGSPELYRFAINSAQGLILRERRSLPEGLSAVTAAAIDGGAVLGSAGGGLWLVSQNDPPREMTTKNHDLIVEAAVSGSSLAFITGENLLGFLPLDYFRLTSLDSLELEQNNGYTRMSPFPDAADYFLLWQADNTHLRPLIRRAQKKAPSFTLRNLALRFPLRSVSVFGEKALFLDSAGNMSVLSLNTAEKTDRLDFSFSSIGSMDAAFINSDHVILGRSGVSGNSPFLIINVNTGETVPLPYPSSAGAKVYRGASGTIYAAVVDQEAGEFHTSIVRLDTAINAPPVRLVEYAGEDTLFSLAESSGSLASTLGGGGAALYSSGGIRMFERGPGLPRKLFDGGLFFIVLDGDGTICWHDSRSGNLLALFRLYENEWILQQEGDKTRWGTVLQPQDPAGVSRTSP